jgi:dipeptidyl aminopeptidase/acylaminoacyl peptidase
VGILGASYGGYAALAGVAFTPTVFRCAVAVAAPANLVTFLRSVPVHLESLARQAYRRIGHPELDADFLRSRSPLSRAGQIRVPVLVVHGANDPRVPRHEAEQLVAALRDNGVPHEYLVFPDEGHGIVRPTNRATFYATAERFLAQHLGGHYEEATAEG